MDVQAQPRLGFLGFDVIKADFKSQKPFEGTEDVDISVNARVYYPSDSDTMFSILMDVSVGVQDVVSLDVQGIGSFEVRGEDIDTEKRKLFVNVNAPAIVFPYMRAFIATLTANCGKSIIPLTIPTQFFKGDLEEIPNSAPSQVQIPFTPQA